MPAPSTSLVTQRPDLGGSFMEFELEMSQNGFIAQRVLPVFESMKQAGPFGKIPIEQLLQERETLRAPGGGYNRGNFTFTTDTFATVEHGWEEPVDDRESQMYAEYFDAEQVSAMRARYFVMSNYEKRVAAALFNTGTFTVQSAGAGLEWTDTANSVPLTDVETAVQAVYDASGLWPNALILTRKQFRNLRNNAQIIDRIKYAGFTDPRAGTISEQALSQAFDLEIIVAGGTKNTANEGAAASLSPIWSTEFAMVTRLATTNDIREPCLGRTIHWAEDGSNIGTSFETYRDERIRGDVVRARHDVDEKVLYVEAAILIDNLQE